MAAADRSAGMPRVSDQNDNTDTRAMAKALVYARTGDPRYRDEVARLCMAAIGTEQGGRTLALGRNLVGYVIAADLVGLPAEDDVAFRAWLRRMLSEPLANRTLRCAKRSRTRRISSSWSL